MKFRPHNYEFLQLSNHKRNIGGRIEKLWFINKHTTITFEYFHYSLILI